MISILFFRNLAFLRNVNKYFKAGQATDENIERANFMLDT